MKSESTANRRLFYLLCLIGFFGIFSTTISKTPVLPLFIRSGLGGGDAVLGLISFFSPLAGMIFSFPVGILLDRLGFKRLLIASALIFTLAPLGYLLVSDIYWLIPLRFFHGLATAILGPLAATAISRQYFETKGAKLGSYSSITLIGRTLAPAVGGFILSAMATAPGLISYRAVYLAAFIAALPLLFMSLAVKNIGRDREEDAKAGLKWQDFKDSLSHFFGDRLLSSTAVIELAIYFAYGIVETFLPVHLKDHGFSPRLIGLIFSLQIITVALSKPLFGKLADKGDKRPQIIGGVVLLAIGAVALAALQSSWLIILASLAFGLGLSLSTAATSIYAADLAKGQHLGSAMGALSSIMDIGQSTGPLIAGILIARFAPDAGFLAALIVCLFAAIYFMGANRNRAARIEAAPEA